MSAAPTWHILGAGALGSLFAAQLRAQGLPCRLLGRRGAAPGQRRVELERPLAVPVEPLEALPAASVAFLLIATKAYDVAPALAQALPALQQGAVVATCANGLGFEAAAARLRPGAALLRAVTTEAAHRQDARVVHAGAGSTLLGVPGGGAAPGWFDASLGRLERWRWEGAIGPALGRKFAINCVLNPLTAVHDCRNGELLQRRALREELAALCAELEPALRRLSLWSGGDSLQATAEAVCRSTAANHSSMLQDRRAGRRTELDYLTGHLLRRAAQAGLSLPHSARLCARLRP